MGLGIGDIGKPAGAVKKRKRVGRGIGSGRGKTSGRGHKGAKSRSGGGVYTPGYEGGQMPLVRRVPKRGFTNKFKTRWSIINIGTLQKIGAIEEGATIDKKLLLEKKVLKRKKRPLKVLGMGKLDKAITVKADAFSESAKKAIEDAGGKAKTG